MWELMCGRTEKAGAEILNTTKNRTDFGFFVGIIVGLGEFIPLFLGFGTAI
jgi:hypothetical protein